jgi:O-antigen/teichoic acid export membrane protein
MRKSRVSALFLIAAQAIGQLALLGVTPVLTRSFTPTELGPYQIALSLALLIQPALTLRLEVYIPTKHTQGEVSRMFQIGMIWMLVIASAGIISAVVPLSLGHPEIAEIILMAVLMSLAYGGAALDSAILIRAGQRRRLAIRSFLAGTVGALLQLCVALWLPSVLYLACAILAGRAISILVSRDWRTHRGDPSPHNRVLPSAGRLALTIVSSFAWNASSQSISLVSGAFLGAGPAGVAGTSQRIASAPVTFIGQSLNQLIQESLSREVRDRTGQLTQTTFAHVFKLSMLSIALAAVISVLAPLLAEPILGKGWGEVGVIVAILAWPFSLQFAVGPATVLLPMLRKELSLFSLQIGRLVLVALPTVVAAAYGGSLQQICIVYSATMVLSYVVAGFLLWTHARQFDRENLRGA